jgi:hypothetical protein
MIRIVEVCVVRTSVYEGYVNNVVPYIREKTSSFDEEKTWLDLYGNRVCAP